MDEINKPQDGAVENEEADVSSEIMERDALTEDIEAEAPSDAEDAEKASVGAVENAGGTDLRRELYDWAQAIVTAIVFVVLLFTFFVRVTGIKGPSMLPTLHENDKVLLSNLFYTPRQGDIVVLTKASFMKDPIVKRVIATEGQKVFFDEASHQVFVDEKPLDEPYLTEIMKDGGIISDPQIVPEGCIFVMGDNRNHSSDSRLSEVGMIDKRDILGKLIVRLYPLDKLGPV